MVRLVAAVLVLGAAACARTPRDPAPALPQAESAPVRAGAAPARARPHVIVVSIDGLMPAAYLEPDAHGLEVPALRRMRAVGLTARGVTSVLPTVTYPAHTTIVTGRSPGAHGIVANKPKFVNSDTHEGWDYNDDGWYWYAEDIDVPTLWDVAEQAGLETAAVNWPVTVGANIDSLVPEFWRAGSEDDQKLARAMATPGLLPGVEARFPDLWERFTPPHVQDSASVDIALHLWETKEPHLMLVHTWMVDERQHRHGPWSAEARQAIEEADRQLGRLLEAVGDEAIVVVVSDHGFQEVHNEIRLGALLDRGGLLEVDGSGKVKEGYAVVVSANGGSAYLYLPSRTAELTARVQRAIAGAPRGAIAAVHEPEEIVKLGGDPLADLWLEAAPGYAFSEAATGPIVAPASSQGTHGYDPRLPSMQASFLAVGPGVPHAEVEGARLTDVAVQIARWLGLVLPDAEGAPFTP